MKVKILFGAVALAGGVLLAGCNDSSSPPAAVMAQPQGLSTAQVLAIAQAPSETDDPKPVVNGALLLADDNDESSDPIPVI